MTDNQPGPQLDRALEFSAVTISARFQQNVVLGDRMKLLVACLLSSLLTVCFASGCTSFAYNEIGTVWTIPHPKFSEISAQHELVAVMPISIRSDLKKNSIAFRDATRLETDEEYVGDLQRFLNAKLMHGIQQGRITVQVQDVEETIKLLDQELQRKEKQGRRTKIAKTRACELLQVDVVAYVELTNRTSMRAMLGRPTTNARAVSSSGPSSRH